jgi:drug/metabolite transporter (DMT)-like permease
MSRDATAGDWLWLFALTLFWGGSFMFTELALRSFAPMTLVAARVIIGAIVLYVFLRVSGYSLPPPGKGWIPLIVTGLLSNAIPFNLIAWAQQQIDSSLTAILIAIVPLFVILLGHWVLPAERLTAPRLAGFGIGFIGVAFIAGPDLQHVADGNMAAWGILAVLAAALCYACGAVYARTIGPQNSLVMSTGMLVAAGFFVAPMALLQTPGSAWPAAPESIAAVLVLGAVATGIASVVYFRLVLGPGPAFLSLVNYIVPVWAALLGALILNESIRGTTLAGMGLILTGIAISEIGHRRYVGARQ